MHKKERRPSVTYSNSTRGNGVLEILVHCNCTMEQTSYRCSLENPEDPRTQQQHQVKSAIFAVLQLLLLDYTHKRTMWAKLNDISHSMLLQHR